MCKTNKWKSSWMILKWKIICKAQMAVWPLIILLKILKNYIKKKLVINYILQMQSLSV